MEFIEWSNEGIQEIECPIFGKVLRTTSVVIKVIVGSNFYFAYYQCYFSWVVNVVLAKLAKKM